MTEETIPESKEVKPETREDTLLFVGETLKNKRLDCSISISNAEKELNIRMNYLTNLESGDWSDMPEEVYAIGFLRQYAKYLKCDLNESIEKIKSNDYALNKPITFPDPPVSPNRKWMIISLIALVILFIVFNVVNQQTTSPLPSEILKQNAQNITETKLDESIPNKAAPVPTVTPQPATKPDQSMNSGSSNSLQDNALGSAPAIKPADKTLQAKAISSTATQQVMQTPVKQVTSSQSNANASLKSTHPLEHTYIFTAHSGDVWLQIFQQGNDVKPLRQMLLKKGKSLRITSNQTLSITTGKPVSLEISMDGKVVVPAGSMAKKNRIVRDFILPRPIAQ